MSAIILPGNRLESCTCGGKAVICKYQYGVRELWDRSEKEAYMYYAECRSCGKHTKEYKSKRKATEVWNRMVKRHADT